MSKGAILCLDPGIGRAPENSNTAVQSSLPDMVHGGDHPEAILAMIWAGKPDDATMVTASKSPEGVFTNTPIKTITAGVANCLRSSERGLDAYHAPAFYQAESHTGTDGKPHSRTAENASGASCWWMDVDVRLDKDAKGDGYATLEGAWHAVGCFCTKVGITPPNIVVVSGGGLHIYWTTGQFVSKHRWVRIARKLKLLSKQYGLRADPHRTADIASVLRPTGTVNNKIADYKRPVFAIRIDPHVVILPFVKSILDASKNLDVAATHLQRTSPSLPILVADSFAAYKGGMGRDWPETPENIRVVKSLLASLTADRGYNGDAIQGHTAWLQLGFALAYLEQVWGWENARDLFDHWSQSCPDRYNSGKVSGRAAIDQLFDSYDPARPDHCRITIGTLIKAAQDEGGWTWPAPDRTNDPDTALDAANPFVAANPFNVTAEPDPATTTPLAPLDLSDLLTRQTPPPDFVIDYLLPRDHVTLLAGHGGTGKSQLALILAGHVAAGVAWSQLRVQRGRVVLFSFEDGADLIYHRLRLILTNYNINLSAVASHLQIFDLTDHGPLVTELNLNGTRGLVQTNTWAMVEAAIDGADLVIIDNASDAYDGDENSRRQVRRFLNWLRGLVKPHHGALLLLAHVDKNTAKYGGASNSYSGSTAWHNSARSRLVIANDQLIQEKLNVGRLLASPIDLEWVNGLPMPLQAGVLTARLQAQDDSAVLQVLQSALTAGRTINAATSGSNTPWHALQHEPTLPPDLRDTAGKKRVHAAISRLAAAGTLRLETYKTQGRRDGTRWVLTTPGTTAHAH